MIGSLFLNEMLLGGRRSRDHILRWIYGGWLILEVLWFSQMDLVLYLNDSDRLDYTTLVCRHFVEVFIPQHFILLALVTPAFIAGAITDEKTNGTLQYLLTTELAPLHIITGKLLARTAQVCTLALVGLPLFALVGVLGGAEAPLLLGLLIVTVLVAAGVSSATFLASVWARQTREAVLGVYVVGIAAVVLVAWIGGSLRYFNPVVLLAPSMDSGGVEGFRVLGGQLLYGLLAWGGLTLVCLALASWRLRPAYIRQLEGAGRSRQGHKERQDRALIGQLPVLWKERHIEGLAPVPALRFVPRWLGIVVVVALTVASSCWILHENRHPGITDDALLDRALHLRFSDVAAAINAHGAADGFQRQAIVAINVFALLVAVRCSGSVTGERERQTWEALLLTPLSLGQLIHCKLWGIMLSGLVYLLAYAIPALLFSLLGGWLAVFWTAAGLAVSVLAMYYLGAVGMWASVRSRGSWQSLLTTVAVAYLAALLFSGCASPIALVLGLLIAVVIEIVGAHLRLDVTRVSGVFTSYELSFQVALVIAVVIITTIAARIFLSRAQEWVGNRERTRHWQQEPGSPRRRRRRGGTQR